MADGRSAWTSDELSRIGEADELEIASLRPDGSLRRPRTVWAVRHGDGIYVRSVNGPEFAWSGGSSSGTTTPALTPTPTLAGTPEVLSVSIPSQPSREPPRSCFARVPGALVGRT
jgi:hypothetical protein